MAPGSCVTLFMGNLRRPPAQRYQDHRWSVAAHFKPQGGLAAWVPEPVV